MKSISLNLMVKDVNETVHYYKQNLGFNLVMNVPEIGMFNWAMVQKGEVLIMFQEENSFKDEFKYLKGKSVGGTFSIYLKMDNVKKFYEEVKGNVTIISKFHKTFYGTDEFAIIDNNGYVLAFAG